MAPDDRIREVAEALDRVASALKALERAGDGIPAVERNVRRMEGTLWVLRAHFEPPAGAETP